MIKAKTAIILGAGASMPYGFPSGKDLISNIIGNLKGKKKVFLHYGYEEELIESFRIDLELAKPQSIDIFLIEREKYKDLGKFAICSAINQREIQGELLMDQVDKGGIYEFFYHKLTDNLIDIRNNNVAFLTFNYDRSLEQYLFVRLSGRRSDKSNVIEEVGGLPIFHIHGSLGLLPWQNEEGLPYKPLYLDNGAPERSEPIFSSRNNIQILNESQRYKGLPANISSFLRTSKNIYFIGFGYHPENLDKLGLWKKDPSLRPKKPLWVDHDKIVGCSYGFKSAEVKDFGEIWSITFPDGTNEMKGLEFIREHVSFL